MNGPTLSATPTRTDRHDTRRVFKRLRIVEREEDLTGNTTLAVVVTTSVEAVENTENGLIVVDGRLDEAVENAALVESVSPRTLGSSTIGEQPAPRDLGALLQVIHAITTTGIRDPVAAPRAKLAEPTGTRSQARTVYL